MFSIDDFGTDTKHRKGGCCPKCFECAIHFEYFCQAFDHDRNVNDDHPHRMEIHRGKPMAIHSCGCDVCRKWLEVNWE